MRSSQGTKWEDPTRRSSETQQRKQFEREPDTIEGWLGFDIEPDWLGQVKKYPSIEKLQETRFNFEMLKTYSPMSREFQFRLSNFLNSSSSVLWYLLNEYSRKYRFEIDKYRKDEKYGKAHQALVLGKLKPFFHGMTLNSLGFKMIQVF